ncbi:MAG: sigma-70 family RNA polymerase sigma factor [Terriglobales bacterium]
MAHAEMAIAGQDASEAALVQAARGGDVDAFGALVKRYDRQVFRIVRHMTKHPEDTEDIVQDAFVKAFSHLKQFEGRCRFSTWLVRIAVNDALMRIRRQQRVPMLPLALPGRGERDEVEVDVCDPCADPEKRYCDDELKRVLTAAINALRPTLRAVFVLRDMEGLSVRETAGVLGITGGAVKARLFRARGRLRRTLLPYLERRDAVPPGERGKCPLWKAMASFKKVAHSSPVLA